MSSLLELLFFLPGGQTVLSAAGPTVLFAAGPTLSVPVIWLSHKLLLQEQLADDMLLLRIHQAKLHKLFLQFLMFSFSSCSGSLLSLPTVR